MCNIIKMVPYNGCSQMLHISLKTEKSFIAHPWCLLSVVGLEEYSSHDWRAATSVQRVPVTWRGWGLWSKQSWGWWFETQSRSLWRHSNDIASCALSSGDYMISLLCQVIVLPIFCKVCLTGTGSVVFPVTSKVSLRDHDDVIKCNHFPRYWSFVRGIHR